MDLLMWLLDGSVCICILYPASSWQETEQHVKKQLLLVSFPIDLNQTRVTPHRVSLQELYINYFHAIAWFEKKNLVKKLN